MLVPSDAANAVNPIGTPSGSYAGDVALAFAGLQLFLDIAELGVPIFGAALGRGEKRRSYPSGRRTNEGTGQMSNVRKIALSAAIILGTVFSVLTAANAGATREQAASSGTGVAAYAAGGGIVSSH